MYFFFKCFMVSSALLCRAVVVCFFFLTQIIWISFQMYIRKGVWSTERKCVNKTNLSMLNNHCSCKDTLMVSQVQSVFFFQITSIIYWNNTNCALAFMQTTYLLVITVNIRCCLWKKYAHCNANFQDKVSV